MFLTFTGISCRKARSYRRRRRLVERVAAAAVAVAAVCERSNRLL
jgi:hypothetical protein